MPDFQRLDYCMLLHSWCVLTKGCVTSSQTIILSRYCINSNNTSAFRLGILISIYSLSTLLLTRRLYDLIFDLDQRLKVFCSGDNIYPK